MYIKGGTVQGTGLLYSGYLSDKFPPTLPVWCLVVMWMLISLFVYCSAFSSYSWRSVLVECGWGSEGDLLAWRNGGWNTASDFQKY